MVGIEAKTFKHIVAKPFAPNLGAEITGVDLSQEISEAEFSEIEAAFLAYQVLFVKDQKEIPPQVHIDLGKRFGPLHSHPAAPTMAGCLSLAKIKIIIGKVTRICSIRDIIVMIYKYAFMKISIIIEVNIIVP